MAGPGGAHRPASRAFEAARRVDIVGGEGASLYWRLAASGLPGPTVVGRHRYHSSRGERHISGLF